ncbi:MAG: ribonuclease HII [Gammaproteobacteria bacterium]
MDVSATGWVAGADEVGRGALAGPVYAAAVIFPPGRKLRGLNDSKQLSAEAREALVPKIQHRAIAWAIATASLEEIERLNILHASLLAMQRAVEALGRVPALLRVDGVHTPAVGCACQAIVGGDAKVPAIMAASVLAKVARDAEMRRLDLAHPGYGFAEHKGYATKQHLEALQRLGPCAIHRRGFEPVMQMQLWGLSPFSPAKGEVAR